MNKLEHSLGYSFKNKSLAKQALTHSSISKKDNYEKLEFLGDSIINYFTTIWLLKNYPEDNEAKLSIKKTQIVNKKSLCSISKSLKLYKSMRININSSISERIHCDIFESIIGAIYVDSDIKIVSKVLDALFKKEITNLKENYDYKGLLISIYKKREIADYNMITERDENNIFFISRFKFDNTTFYGFGNNKKNAEQRCSRFAYKHIKNLI